MTNNKNLQHMELIEVFPVEPPTSKIDFFNLTYEKIHGSEPLKPNNDWTDQLGITKDRDS